METSELLLLEAHGIDPVLFDQMVGTLELEDQRLLGDALETVPVDRRGFIAKTMKPYLLRYEESTHTGEDAAMFKYADLGKIAMMHAAALTHLPSSIPMMQMTTHQSEVFLKRVINMVFFYPLDVAAAYHRDDMFVDAVCGAGMHVLTGDTSIHYVNELALKGRSVREAEMAEAA